MTKPFKKFLFSLPVLATVLFTVGNDHLHAQDKTMIQGFYWDAAPGSVWYDSLAAQAPGLARMGIHSIWFPPPAKGDGQLNVGYTPYDYYDLGEYDSQSGNQTSGTGEFIPTRYGTRAQLENALHAFQSRGVEVYADIVLNHRSGGIIEDNPFAHWYTDRHGGSLFSPDGEQTYTAFPLTNGSGRIAWNIGDGSDFFYPNAVRNPDNTGDFYADNQLAGFHQMYVNSFGYANALHDGDGSNLPMGDSLQVWGDWLSGEIGFDGYRIDFVKGIHPTYLTNWLNYGSNEGTFHVHELFDGSIDRLKTYLNLISGTTRQGTVFDFNLRFAYKELSDQGDNYDIRNLLGRGLYYDGVSADRIVTFVENHDFDRADYRGEINQAGHSPVVNRKLPIYAHMMSLPPKATIWYRDMYWYGMKDQLTRLVQIRSNFISGAEYTNSAFTDGSGTFQQPFWPGDSTDDPRQMMVIQRTGMNNETGVIMAINKHGSREIEVWISQVKEEWIGKVLYDISGNMEGTTEVFADGRVLIKAGPDSYSAWVPLDHVLDDEVDISLGDIHSPTGTQFINDPFVPAVRVQNNGLFSQTGIEVSYEITDNGSVIHSGAKTVSSVEGSSSHTVEFNSVEITTEGEYQITFTADYSEGTSIVSVMFSVTDPDAQVGIQVDGIINEPSWVTFAEKLTTNSGFGPNKDVRNLLIYADDDSLYIAVDGELAEPGNNGDGFGIMLEFSELDGIPAGTPIGPAPGAVHFLNPGDQTNANFTMSFDVDLGISMSWSQQKVVLSIARYSPEGNEGAVVLSSTQAPGGDGEMGIGPVTGSGFLPENSVRYAFRVSENLNRGLELAISKSALGITTGDVRGFGFIVSGTSYFSNVTAPGNISGVVSDGAGNPGFNTQFHLADGGPFVSGWVSIETLDVDGTLPGVPQLVESDELDLKWYPVPNADQYEIQIAFEDSEFEGDLLIQETVTDTLYTFEPEQTGDHYWRVRAVNDVGAGDWSEPALLEVGVVSSIDGNELPREVALSQNYPNPFNPVTIISYRLPVTGEVKLEVFDITGRKITTLVNNLMEAGPHEVTFDASRLASGVYIYRLSANGAVLTRQLTLIK